MSFIIKARGLPWSASVDDVLEFFGLCNIVGGANGVHFTKTYDGRPSGQCYLVVESEDDVQAAQSRDKDKMGKRYIEVFQSSVEEMEADLNKGKDRDGNGIDEDAVVRLRGLPFSATKYDIQDFFSSLDIEQNGILLVNEPSGRSKGEAFVQFTTPYGAKRALEMNKKTMGHRYIEVFVSSMAEAKRAQSQMTFGPPMRGGGPGPMRGGGMGMRPGPYDRSGGFGNNNMGRGNVFPPGMRGGFAGSFPGAMMGPMGAMNPMMLMGGMGGMRSGRYVVRMRGLPFRVTEQDIAEWFSSVADPVDIYIKYNHDHRPSGEAEVIFATEGDAKRAMQKDRQNMQHRYIELFLEGSH